MIEEKHKMRTPSLLEWETEEIILATGRFDALPVNIDPFTKEPHSKGSHVDVIFRDLEPGLIATETTSRTNAGIGFKRARLFLDMIKEQHGTAIIKDKSDGREIIIQVRREILEGVQCHIRECRQEEHREDYVPEVHLNNQPEPSPRLSDLQERHPDRTVTPGATQQDHHL